MRSFTSSLLMALICFVAGPVFATVPTITSFSPTQGPIGTTIIVTGTAFTGATSTTIGGVAATFKVPSATQVTATLPATASGKIVIVTPGGTATSSATFTVTPGAITSPSTTHAGGKVTVTASGMDPYTSMDVFFDSTDVALAVSNGSGIAAVTLNVPDNAGPNTHYFTFDERSTHKAAQAAITINADWLQADYGFNGAGYNPYEGALDSTTVPNLDTLWVKPNGPYSNREPLVESSGTVFVSDTGGNVHAYSSTGAVVWTASFGGFVTNRNPVIYGSNVYFSNQTNIYAYAMKCGSKGATCQPLWTAAIASYDTGLTEYNGTLYIGATDGNIYPINPATGAIGTPFYAVNTSDGAISTPIAFNIDGSYAYGAGDVLHFSFPGVGAGTYGYSYAIGPIAFKGNLAYYETGDGILHELRGEGWSATLSGTYCTSAPAVAYGMVFAGDCSYVWGFNAATGSARWTFSGGYVSGISVANHIVYACASNTIVALDATYGTYLWGGGSCSSAPVVANGMVYDTYAGIYAFTIPSLSPSIVRHAPAVASLKPDLNLVAVRTPELVH
jgi:hypothetical protein